MRGFMLDSARGLESRDYYRRFIDFAAERGVDTILWHFTDDQGCALRFDTLPEAASPNAYTKDEMRELVAYAAGLGVTIIPELETLGHTRYITNIAPTHAHLSESERHFSTICPVARETREIISQLLDEVLDVFDAPLIHVGLDEVDFGDHPLTREALKSRTKGDIFADHINFLHAYLAKHNRRLMMWGDHLLQDETIVQAIPRDILVGNWQYHPDVAPDTTQKLLDWGFDVVACPAVISHNHTIYAGEKWALPNLRSMARHLELDERVIGTMVTIWTPPRYISDSLWPVLDYAAAIMRDGPDVDRRQCLLDFAEAFHNLAASDDWLAAIETLFDHAPRRQPWLAAMRLKPDDSLKEIHPTEEADRFQQAGDHLRTLRDNVRTNRNSYDALLLVVDLIAHVWERYAQWQAGKLTASTLAASEAMAERLSAAWDAERFADDPRKWEPVLSFDEGNHLLVIFEQGTQVLREVKTKKP